MQYLSMLLSFAAGGGLLMIANWKINQKSLKVDYADKAINFMERQNEGLMRRVTALEVEVKHLANELLKYRCNRIDCPNRLKPEA